MQENRFLRIDFKFTSDQKANYYDSTINYSCSKVIQNQTKCTYYFTINTLEGTALTS